MEDQAHSVVEGRMILLEKRLQDLGANTKPLLKLLLQVLWKKMITFLEKDGQSKS